MDPHPDFVESALPRFSEFGEFRLTPLSPEVVEEDFEAATSSEALLRGLWGDDWPAGLTLEYNAIDLAWHEREFTTRRSFAWVIRDAGGTYLGCAYVYPTIGGRGTAVVTTWFRDMPDRDATAQRFNGAFSAWLSDFIPEDIALTWRTSPAT